MRIVLTGGVTGGHIYPAIAIGDRFKSADPDNEVIYIASGHPLEKQIIPASGYELYEVSSEPFVRKNILHIAKTLGRTLAGRRESLAILKKFKPDVVISTGSYVSVPVVLAARSMGAAVYLHEQNGYPGVSNRFLSRFADKVFLGFEAAGKYFGDSVDLVYSGNPVRKEFSGRNREADRKALGIPKDDFVIVVFGGSQGSATTNAVGEAVAREYADREGYTIIWGTGSFYFEEISKKFEAEGFAPGNVKIMSYISDMPAMLSACNVSISRSGALSVAETSMAGRFAIFIPSPNVTEDHQYYNARALADKGGAIIVREDDGEENTVREVTEILRELDKDREVVVSMEEASRSAAPVNATDIIYDAVMASYNRRRTGSASTK